MRTAFLSWFLLLVFFLSGCAGPVLDLPEPTNQKLTEAHRLLDHHKLPPVTVFPITREDSGSYVDAYSPTKYRMRDAVARFCDRTHLGRCDEFSSLPYPAMEYNPKMINAHADQHDRIIVYSGLVDTLGVQDELGAVLAHEYAHVLLGHVDKSLTNAAVGGVIFPLLLGGLAVAADVDLHPSTYFDAADLGMVVGSRAYSPEMELEADRLSVYILEEAGYSLTAMRDALVRLHRAHTDAQSSGLGTVGFLETHPSSDRRMAHMLATIEDVLADVPWMGKTARVVVEEDFEED
ncbi:MAG: M48 family metalloprotease [Nitrospira sp. SB0675_bin_23]|nr:M48 family metalloprotease [Nitrospira sp. SB0667_bin_9]MYD31600.1 M48 family metalloprotease [Nitrospira sp. SB0661_bin_20]MYH01600.1 M48 family metalloprotease [Nitrospira sp. SB0675_bin_23]MYJ23778.1 M48 family metalloprotease [Nitrospira sp. SB0673_bin_12]